MYIGFTLLKNTHQFSCAQNLTGFCLRAPEFPRTLLYTLESSRIPGDFTGHSSKIPGDFTGYFRELQNSRGHYYTPLESSRISRDLLYTCHRGFVSVKDILYISIDFIIRNNKEQACCAGCRHRPFPMQLRKDQLTDNSF